MSDVLDLAREYSKIYEYGHEKMLADEVLYLTEQNKMLVEENKELTRILSEIKTNENI